MDFETHLKKYLTSQEIDSLISSFKEESKHALLLNTEKWSVERFLLEFPLVKPHPIVKNCFIYDNNIYPFGKMVYFEMGLYYLFEPCSPLVSYLLNPNKDDLILDIASAPGGKSIHTSLLMENEGLIISNEIQTSRSHILSSNVERMGRKNMIVTNNDIDAFYPRFNNTFTKIILDAPCSGSGMFRKMEEMKSDWTYQKVLSLSTLQKELILKAYSLLAPNGTLVYSTCSFSYEEDEEVIKYLLDNTDAELINIEDSKYFYKSKEKIGIHLFPYLFDGEGHYICLIKKSNNYPLNKMKDKEDNFKKIHQLLDIKDGYILNNNNDFYLINKYFDTSNLHLIRCGLKLGTNEKYGFELDYAYSHYLNKYKNQLNLSFEDTKKYLFGEQLFIDCEDGYVLLKYNDISLGFGKSKNNKINNKYPKGLRRKY